MKTIKTILPDATKENIKIDAFILPNLYGGLDCDNCQYYIPRFFDQKYQHFVFDESHLKGYSSYVRQGFLNAFRSFIEDSSGPDLLNNIMEDSHYTSSVVTIPNVKIENILVKDILVITKIDKSTLSDMITDSIKFAVNRGCPSVALPFIKCPEYSQNEVSEDIVQGINNFFSENQSDIQIYILLRKDLGVLAHTLC